MKKLSFFLKNTIEKQILLLRTGNIFPPKRKNISYALKKT